MGISLIHGAASIDYLSTMSYSFHRGDLPKLDIQVDRGSDFKAWKSQWEAYLSLSGLGTQSNAKQVQALTLCLSRETVTIVDNLGLSEAQRGSVKDVVDAIQSYVEGLVNESVERRIFRRRGQQPGETFDDFLVSLRELAKTCKFCSKECTDKNIRDQIIQGLLDGDTIEDLLKERDLPELSIGSKVAVHNSCTKLWDIYGNITAIGPYRRYHIKTAGGRVLIRNRRYIRRRFPAAPPGYQHATLPAPAPSPTPDSATTPPRRSSRPHTRPPRLIEEIGSTYM